MNAQSHIQSKQTETNEPMHIHVHTQWNIKTALNSSQFWYSFRLFYSSLLFLSFSFCTLRLPLSIAIRIVHFSEIVQHRAMPNVRKDAAQSPSPQSRKERVRVKIANRIKS